jgi:hypothetical protein
MSGIQRLSDRQTDHGIAEELETFVVAGRGIAVLVVPARMDECLLKQPKVADRQSDPRGEGLGRTHAVEVLAGACQDL